MGDLISRDLVLSIAEANLPANLRWAAEQQKLKRFPYFHFLSAGSNVVAAVGALDTFAGNSYGMRVELDGFPYSLPSVLTRHWEIHPLAPHKFGDNKICLMKQGQWRQYYTVALVVAKTAIWLNKYELWKRNGHKWPGREQPH